MDRGRDMVAVEVKSGATIHPSFFGPLEHFEALAREAVPHPEEGVQQVLVYGGNRQQQRSAGLVLPWDKVESYPWIGV